MLVIYLVKLVKIYTVSLLPVLIDLVNKDDQRQVWFFKPLVDKRADEV